MKYVDITIQTIILFLTATMMTMYSWSGLMYGQLFIGIWQMISSVVSVSAGTPNKNLRRIHLLLATIYLILLAIGFRNHEFILLTVPPWMLAFFYYTITWKWVLSDQKKGKFLRNISF
jgi:CDP-diglyceride synthetase